MSIVINGFDVADDEPYWWGWQLSNNGHNAHGYVDPDARADFFEEIKQANIAGGRTQTYTHPLTGHQHVQRTMGRLWVADTATGSILVGSSIPNWTYLGDDPRMHLYICCASIGAVPITPAFVTAVAAASDNPSVPLSVQIGNAEYLLVFAGLASNSTDPPQPVVSSATWWQSRTGGAVPADPSPQDLSLIAAEPGGSDHDIEAWHLLAPDPSTDIDSAVVVSSGDGRFAHAALVYADVDASSPVRATASNTGTGTSASVSVACQAGDRVVAALSYHGGGTHADSGPWVATVGSGWTERATAVGTGVHKSGIHVADTVASGSSVTATWSVSGNPGNRGWSAMAVVLRP